MGESMIINETNSLAISVESMVAQLSDSYVALIENSIPFKNFPSVMLWGPPGIGKSQGIKQIAKEIEDRTGKKVVVTDVRLLLFNPVDLRGIPTANEDKTLAVWLKPKIFQMDESADVVNILLLDEISAAPQSVQAAAYQITLDRIIGEHKLPENCIVVAAGNRVTDKSVAYTMPKALANRLCHIEITSEIESWRNWAISHNINRSVLGFIDAHPDMLMNFDAQQGSLAFPTPRSWEMVSNILNNVSNKLSRVFNLVAGCIGLPAAYEFRRWCEVYEMIPDVASIFAGETSEVPVRPEALYALTSSIAAEIVNALNNESMKNLLRYIKLLPTEFRNRVYLDIVRSQKLPRIVTMDREFMFWFQKNDYDIDDYELIS